MGAITAAELLAGAEGLRDEWLRRAACGGLHDVMDPPLGDRDDAARDAALAVCWSCPVLYECREWVLGLPPKMSPGWVVGGLTEAEIATWRVSAGHIPDGYKRCTRCRQIRHLDEFHAQPQGLDRKNSACGTCVRLARRARRKKETP